MAQWIKVLATAKPCSAAVSHENCSMVGIDLGLNPIPSTVANMLEVIFSKCKFNYLFS